MSNSVVSELTTTVQFNCHVSDARHGADDSLCVYLMRMREYYRWEKGLPYGSCLERDAVGEWLQSREQLWEELETATLRPIEIGGERFDPFDADAINRRLTPHGLVYGGGLGNRAKPHFVLGTLERETTQDAHHVLVVARELARDLTAPAAMTRGHTIVVRRESLRRTLWEKLETWRWNRPDNALGRAFACDDFDGSLERALDAMTEREMATLLWHEQGEAEAGQCLGEEWNELLMACIATPAELVARAVRDHLADCFITLPALAKGGHEASLHLYIGNLGGMRKHLFPALQTAYEEWRATGEPTSFLTAAEHGRAHWMQVAEEFLALYRASGPDAADAIHGLVERIRLAPAAHGIRSS
ncbi:hypothetical protein CKO25_13435 [Thiocapsa imhoffii]|uniref:Uncharacterized protein n=1 Tax=Thiocapsa imhoffii TaxID=382777 RepID=A0A9X0WJG4_9GAMM|nr:Sfum_1244 family protein [Thiocapsa imhoffii]MBK1645630.1 hypothetical protein [Thiocapsa imhoffii]